MSEDGYRLRVREVRDLSMVMDGFRADALRILARNYGRAVAAEAVRRLDLHVLGRSEEKTGSGPLADANAAVRETIRSGGMDAGCEIALYLVGDAVLARFILGNSDYRRAWESRREVVRWGWSATAAKPKAVSETNWKGRELCWRAAMGKPGLPIAFRFSLLNGAPPQLGWGGVRRHLPSLDDRLAAILAMPGFGPREQVGSGAEFRRSIAVKLPREITKELLADYPERSSPKAKPRTPSPLAAGPTRVAIIDHADVVQSSDGRVFVAVPFVGLDAGDRVFIQVADRHVAITQNATQFGFVSGVPRAAVDLLRECKTVTLVEVEFLNGQRLLRARHIAIVQDISLSENAGRALGRWRSKGAVSRNDGEIRQWDSRESRTTD